MNKVKAFFQSHQDLSYWLLFTGLATFILFFISPDSYFNDLHSRGDSAWFFMCGKAWMNGLVPYVDFSDSKGPLLWLIYGCGYLLSHTDYLGVFWISCLWYGLTFLFAYKTASIFLPERRNAIFCTILMSLAFFNPWFHDEIRAEDFCLLFITISLYESCIIAWGDSRHNEKRFFVLGACFAALFLIKFNIAAMQAMIVLGSLFIIIITQRQYLKPILWGLSGAVLICLPFLIYFIISGNLTDFIQEYIYNTLSSVAGIYTDDSPNLLLRTQIQFQDNSLVTYLFEWAGIIYEPAVGSLFLFLLIGSLSAYHNKKKWSYLLPIITFLFFAIAIRHHFYYYFTACTPLLLFFIIDLLKDSYFSVVIIRALSLIAIGGCILAHFLVYNFKTVCFNNNQNQQDYYTITSYIHQIHHPYIINAGCEENGFGTIAEALPAGKYWALQYGASEEMREVHRSLVLSGKADFIIVRRYRTINTRVNLSLQDIEKAGYHIVYIFDEGNSVLLSNKELKEPTLSFPSKWEVFKKHFPFSEINE